MKFRIQIRHSLLLRLLASYLFFAFAPVLLVGWMLIQTAETAIKETILNRNEELARKSAEQIETIVSHAKEILKITAQNPAFYRMNQLTQELIINNLVQEYPVFRKVSFLDTVNNVIISTEYSMLYSAFEQSFLDSVQTTQPGLSTIYLSGDQLPCMLMVLPIQFRNYVVGRLVAEISLQIMWNLIDRDVKGISGEAFVVDENGKYIAHSDRRKVYLNQKLNEPDLFKIIANRNSQERINTDESVDPTNHPNIDIQQDSVFTDAIQFNKADSTIFHGGGLDYKRKSDGERYIAAYAWIHNLKWGFVIQQPAVETLRSARHMRIQVLFVIAGILIAAAVLAYLYTRHIVRPVHHLVAGIEQFSTGNLNYRIDVEAKDEIGTLSGKFNEMADRLLDFQHKLRHAERMETLGRMASMISHEIRNPLNSMVINLRIIKRELPKSKNMNLERINKYYDIITSEIARIDKLVNDFLLISKPVVIQREPIDARDILDDVVLSQQANTSLQGVTVECLYKQSEGIVTVDRERMRQVFLNIYLNAIQAMPEGGSLKINLSTISILEGIVLRSWVVVEFVDNGIGISPEELDKIFNFYYSTKSCGSGLGLTIVQQIVEEHGGRVKIKSTVGEGTTFSVLLPTENSNK